MNGIVENAAHKPGKRKQFNEGRVQRRSRSIIG